MREEPPRGAMGGPRRRTAHTAEGASPGPVDYTRGEPPHWQPDEVRVVAVEPKDGHVQGHVHLATADGSRSYRAQPLGFVRTEQGRVVAFDLIACGAFRGEGRYTRGAPAGEFPFAVSLILAGVEGSTRIDEHTRLPIGQRPRPPFTAT